MGMEGFAAPVKVTCNDHNGHNKVYVAQWDGTKWTKASDWIRPMSDKVRPLLEAAAKEYAEKNSLAGPHRSLRRQVRQTPVDGRQSGHPGCRLPAASFFPDGWSGRN
jgi:hypothetical protein